MSAVAPLKIASGTIEAIKWLAVIFMTIDHANAFLFAGVHAWMFSVGRLALPLFAFVLAYNLARPQALERGAYQRTLVRLAAGCVVATIPFVLLSKLQWGWLPINVMGLFFTATACLYFFGRGGLANFTAGAALFAVGGALTEFWWPGLVVVLTAHAYCRRPTRTYLLLLTIALAMLYLSNQSSWAMGAIFVIVAAPYVHIPLPRSKSAFYIYYPVHLVALLIIRYIYF